MAPGECEPGDRECDAAEEDQPLGHHRHQCGHGVRDRGGGLGALGVARDRERPHWHEQRPDHLQHNGDAAHDLRVGAGEPAADPLHARRPGVLAHRGGAAQTAAGDHEAPGTDLVACHLGHRVRLAGEGGLVEFEARGGEHLAVHHELVAGTERDDVVQHHVRHRHLRGGAVPDDRRAGGGDQGEPVEGALRAEFLGDADRGVGHQDEPEQSVPPGAVQEDQHQQGAEHEVEPRQQVRAEDLRHRPARA